jgi:hypothetical protein
MQLLDDHLWVLFVDKQISLEEMLDKARQPGAMLEKAEKAGLADTGPDGAGYGPVLKT